MPAAKSGGGKLLKDPGKGPADAGPGHSLKAQHGQLTNENVELKALRSQLLAKEKAMREKIEKLRAIAAATGKNFKPTGNHLMLEAPKLKSFELPRVSTPHTPLKPKLLKGFKGGMASPKKVYKPMKIPVKVPNIKPSGDPELDKLRREAAILEAQNAVLARQRSGLRRGVKTLAEDKSQIAQNVKRISGGYKGKRSKLKMILAKHNKYHKKSTQLEQKTSRKMAEIQKAFVMGFSRAPAQKAFRAKGLEFPGGDDRLGSSPPKRRMKPGRPSRDQRQRARRDVLRGRRLREQTSAGQASYGSRGMGAYGLDARMSPTTPRRGGGKLRAPRRNRSKSLPRAHTQSYLRSRDRRHNRAHHHINLSKNSYSRSRRMSRQRDRPSEVDVPRRNSLQDLRRLPALGKSVDDDVLMRESRKRIQAQLAKRMVRGQTRGGGNELPQLEAYSSLPDLRASSERNYTRGDENQPLSRVTEEPNGKISADVKSLKTTLVGSKARTMGYGLSSTRRLMNALKELSPNGVGRIQTKRSKARRKSIQRAKKKKRAKAANKAAASSVPTEAGRKDNIVYSQSLNNLQLAMEHKHNQRSLMPRGALDERASYSAKDFDMLWAPKLRGLLPSGARSSAKSLLRSASQQRVRETPGKDNGQGRRHSLGAFDFESLYTRKSPRTKRRNKNKERSKSVHHGRAPGGVEDRVLAAARAGRRKLRSKSSEGFRSNLGALKITLPGKKGAGSRAMMRGGGFRDPLDEAMSDFRKLTPENFESKYKKLHKRVKKGMVRRTHEEKPRYDEFVSSLKAGTRNRIAASKKGSYLKGRLPGSPDAQPMPSYKKRNNDWWARMNNLKAALDTLST